MSELKLQQSRLDGRYDILECLGRGSYAEIYVANDNAAPEGEPRTIVIKALNLYLQDAPDVELERTLVANFQNEAVALDRVRHFAPPFCFKSLYTASTNFAVFHWLPFPEP